MSISENGEKYPALKIIAGYFEILAWFVLLLTAVSIGLLFLATIYSNSLAMMVPAFFVGIIWIIGAMTAFVLNRAMGEIIHVFIDIERNTRLAGSSLGGSIESNLTNEQPKTLRDVSNSSMMNDGFDEASFSTKKDQDMFELNFKEKKYKNAISWAIPNSPEFLNALKFLSKEDSEEFLQEKK